MRPKRWTFTVYSLSRTLDSSTAAKWRYVFLSRPRTAVSQRFRASPLSLHGGAMSRWRRQREALSDSNTLLLDSVRRGGFLSIEVDPSGADSWKLEPVVELLKQGAVGVIPTDTVYAIVCDCKNHSAVERLRRIKKIESSKPLSILCRSLRDIDTYTMGFPRGDGHGHANVFRAVKQCLPGPYTFILTASKELPKQCVGYGTTSVKYASRKNVGVRISDDALCQAILQALDAPLICTSVKGPKENEWMIDPITIGDIYGPEGLDFVVDGGVRVAEPSTIVDMTGPYPKVIREGKGPILPWMVVEDDDDSLLRQDLIASGT